MYRDLIGDEICCGRANQHSNACACEAGTRSVAHSLLVRRTEDDFIVLLVADCHRVLLPSEVAHLISEVIKNQGIEPTAPSSSESLRTPSARALALAYRFEHPEWTHAQVAEAVGCSVRQLHRYPEYKSLTDMCRERASRVRGSKDRDGNLEAWLVD